MRELLASRIGNAFIVGIAVAMALACGRSPTSPSPASEPRTLTVVSGWDQRPVAGATVHLDNEVQTTSGIGEFTVPATLPSGRLMIDIDATGFLPHQTRLSAVPRSDVIALWPAANDAEAAAIRAMVFYEDRQAGVDSMWRPRWVGYHLALLVDGSPRAPSEIAAEWVGEYRDLEALTNLPLNLTFAVKDGSDEFDEQVIVALDAVDESCRDPWGFCSIWTPKFPYYSRPYRLAANRPDVIRRVLASGLLNWNPLPGLLNKSNPAPELSLLERQTLRMVFLRPVGTVWPDTDPSR